LLISWHRHILCCHEKVLPKAKWFFISRMTFNCWHQTSQALRWLR
jgi:hypothetical protein